MRDPTKLQAFALADRLALMVYQATDSFPRREVFGLAQQMRRAAVSCASNIVEGCARNSQTEYIHFLDMAYGSACELQYQASLAMRLGFLPDKRAAPLIQACTENAKVLNGLIRTLRRT